MTGAMWETPAYTIKNTASITCSCTFLWNTVALCADGEEVSRMFIHDASFFLVIIYFSAQLFGIKCPDLQLQSTQILNSKYHTNSPAESKVAPQTNL